MTIASTVSRDGYLGSGTTGPFAYTFKVFAVTDLLVTKRDADGLETTLNYPGDFTATGIGSASGGNITLTTALASGYTLSIRRVRPLTQGTELRNQGPYYPQTIEDAFDNAAMVAQQLEDELRRAPMLPETIDPDDFDTTLPANLSPGDAIVVNATGDGFSMTTIDDVTLSAWNAAQNMKLDVFTSSGGFTPGVTTTLTLSAAPGSINNVFIVRRTSGTNVVYETDEYSVASNVVTFSVAIPSGTTRVEVRYLKTYQVNTADAVNVTYAPASGSGTDVQTRLRSIDNRLSSLVVSVKDAPYSATGDGSTDDASAINAAATAVDAAGGGQLFFPPGTYVLGDDVEITRLVEPVGCGPGASILQSTTGKALKLKGSGGNWSHTIRGLCFDGVQVLYGETNADLAQGAALKDCEVKNADVGVRYVYNAFLNTIDNCMIHDCATAGVEYDLATGGVSSGAKQVISNSALFNLPTGIVFYGGPGGFDLYVTNTDIEHIDEAGVKTVGATEDSIFLDNVHFELYDAAAYFVVNDGAHVFIDGFWALSATEAAWFQNASGEIYIKNGRGSWNSGQFAEITGGLIQVDPTSIFCASRWWGEGVTPMVTAGSNGGQIISARDRFVGQANKTLTVLTNASPGPLTAATIEPRDGNERVFEFDIACTTTAANNSLRIDLTNGHSTVRNDLLFPLVDGGAHVIVTHTPGGTFTASAVYAPSSAGNAQRFSLSTTDTSTLDDLRNLTFETINGGAGTKATIAITNFFEYVSGPRVTGL